MAMAIAVPEAMLCARSLCSFSDAFSRICIKRFRVKVSRASLVSEYKTSEESENKIKDLLQEDDTVSISSRSYKYRTSSKIKKVESEISQFLATQEITDAHAVKIISKLNWCLKLVICDLHASRRACTIEAIKTAIMPYVETLINKQKESLNGDLQSDINGDDLSHLNENKESLTGDLQSDLFYLTEELNLTQIKPYIDFLYEIGSTESTVYKILEKFPRFCGLNIKDDIKPVISLLISYGLDEYKLPKIVERWPLIFYMSIDQMELILNYLHRLGLSKEHVFKVLERFPNILSYSVDNLEIKVNYFKSLGVNLVKLVTNSPQCLALSLEEKIIPVTNFFLNKGFSKDEMVILSHHGHLYCCSLEKCIVPKWEYFCEMGYEQDLLVKYPVYFILSLERRIKPRFERGLQVGVRLPFYRIVFHTDAAFERYLKNKYGRF